jgi:prepilin-type N-terminal cleavage/methylation domain-containing protein
LARSRSFNSDAGFSLIEVLAAMVLMAVGLMSLVQMFGLSTRNNLAARSTTYATVLAEQKLEELRALTWGFDVQGLPVSDTSTDTTVTPETPSGGTGLSPSPGGALRANTPGWVDYVDQWGDKLGGGAVPPENAVYTRRWSVEPLPTNPNNTLIIQVLVTRLRDRGAADEGRVTRLPDEARLVTVKTRKAR